MEEKVGSFSTVYRQKAHQPVTEVPLRMMTLLMQRSLWILRMMVAEIRILAGPRVGLTKAAGRGPLLQPRRRQDAIKSLVIIMTVMHPALQVVEVDMLHKLSLK